MSRPSTAPTCRAAFAALGLCLALVLVLGPAVLAQGPTGREIIAEVVVVGNRAISTDRIMREIHTRAGLTYSGERAQDDASRLAATRLFKNVSVRAQMTNDGRVIVIYQVQEHPNIVREVIFKHAKHLSNDELLSMTRIRKGMPLDVTLNRLAVFEIQDALRKKGRLLASVTLEEGFDESHTRVVFNITEGPITRVRSTSFTGNEFASGGQLRTHIDTSRTILGLMGQYHPEMVEEDVHKLEEYYRKNGFRNAQVTRQVEFSDDFQYVDITFHIKEGTRFRIKSMTIDGAHSLPLEQLKTIPQVKQGDWYNENIIEKDKRNLADFFGWRGYPVNVAPVVLSVQDEPGVVRVQYQVEERPPLRVGRVIIVGNTVTEDRVIRRALGIYPGQVLRLPELRLAEANLTRLGIFETDPQKGSRPVVQAIDNQDDPNVKDIIVHVKETHTGTFNVGAGFNTNNGLVGTITLNERNFALNRIPTSWEDFLEGRAFRGGNQELNIQAIPGIFLQRYSVTWRDPMLFDLPYSLTTSGYYRQYQYNEYLEQRLGGMFTIGKQIFPWLSANVGGRIEDIGVHNVAAGAPIDYTSVIGDNFLLGVRGGFTIDKRNSFIRPTEGGRLDVSVEQTFGSYTFPILNVLGSQFFTVTERKDGTGKHVLALHSQLGLEGSNAPVYERFFAGGMQSIRGFMFRGVGPNEGGYMLGGTFMFLNSIEYQIPILASDSLYFVTFVDSGTVESTIGIRDYRVAAGFGFRIAIPALGPVPLAIDFGFPIVRTQSDQTQVFQLWVGYTR